ncbi:ABC transporter ATP-binding protein [Rubrivivax benzoatilyticus]|uniref:ABC transporter ATP-binding protein n=1 Tax=Rubrivivax benzoatilyticus TaxID=316997 RepID=A0ABX0I074_9BURK|nr:ABC transporter ATP-binding protein [Rubrivivax benzoatilyticus]NHK99991.1 ABC transporter ATP-binding protein [Rubrivivax benzoatilyticus]NHL25730.1 ABC transporter ATP-binding protein [Rubrivivax benzoatilyticus]
MGALSIRSVRKAFGKTEILKGIDIEVEAGDFLILVGPSGCGKSTLLNMIAGLDAPSSGRIFIDGRDVTDVPSKDRDIAMVFQSYALYPNMDVRQNIAFALEMRKVPKAEREAAVQRVAKMLQIDHLLDRKPGALSGGQRQRVAMGRALARDPKLFLFDEPLSNLDAKLRVEMRAEIKLLHQRTQTTTVYVTHDQVEAMTLGDHIAVMKDGAVQQLGSPHEIYTRPATRFVAEFIGSPAMNMIVAQRSADGGLTAAGHALPLTAAQRQALAGGSGDVIYGLRPENVCLGEQGLPGELVIVEPTGPETYMTAHTVAGKLTARLPGTAEGRVGGTVHLHWAAEHAHLFDAASDKRIR